MASFGRDGALKSRLRRRAGRILACLAAAGLLAAAAGGPAAAQEASIPNLWDPRARLDRPDISTGRTVRFLTDDEFPPLTFAGPDGAPTGFVVELARAACERLTLTCTVQARRFDTLLPTLAEGRGDVVAAAIPINADLRRAHAVTQPLFRFPARFSTRKDRAGDLDLNALKTARIGVVAGTAHEAYLAAVFPTAPRQPFPDLGAAQGALRAGDVDYLFADGLALALWIGGTGSADCCALVGGPFLESRFFGEGIGFVLRPDDDVLRRALDYALQRLWDEGKYAELYLRFFPVGPF
jgi:polar amino acid transport system substrate-binding protein